MKYYLFSLMFLIILMFLAANIEAENHFGMSRFPSSEKAPAPFEDSDIERTLKDGKIQKFDGNKYMIIRRGQSKKVRTEAKPDPNKNRLSLILGHGPTGDLYVYKDPLRLEVETTHDFNLGIQYQRLISEDISLGVQIKSNEDKSILMGVDF